MAIAWTMGSDTRRAGGENDRMAESVQRAATRRGQEFDVLATVYDAVLAMRDCIAETTRVLEVTTGKIEAQDAQLAEQGDAILALSNRIESLTKLASQDEFNRRFTVAIDGPR